MKIAIDGYEANTKNRVGIGRYAYEILIGLEKIAKKHDVTVFLPSKPLSDMPPWQYSVIGPKRFWTFIGLPWALAKQNFDVVFSPTHYIPRFVSTPRVMSIMDMSFLEYSELFRKKDLYQLVNWTRYGARHAKRILTISEFSKNAIINAYGVPKERVVVTYPGLNMETVKKQSTYKNYILSVGTLQPRKNYIRLIEAFSKLDSDLTLIIVGKKGWMYEEILAAPLKYGVASRVKFLDYVPDEDLPGLYQGARCFALPSLYEGFGLPVLEAMAQNCPVVVSNISSLPEIAGNEGIYIDPMDVDSIVHGMKEGLKVLHKSSSQVKKFRWEKAAKQTLEVLENI